jgi:hypothetical protein
MSLSTSLKAIQNDTMTSTLLVDLVDNNHTISDVSAVSQKYHVLITMETIKQLAFDLERGFGSKLLRPMNISRVYLARKHQYYGSVFDALEQEKQSKLMILKSHRSVESPPSALPPKSSLYSFEEEESSPIELSLPSSLLTQEQQQSLSSILPGTIAWIRWELVYTTSRDGWELSRLYRLTTNRRPCLLLFYLRAPYEQVVLGALHGDIISPPSNTVVRGNGKINRVFALQENKITSYNWVGLNSVEQFSMIIDELTATQFQWGVSAVDYLCFGASATHHTNAIRFEGKEPTVIITGPSDTYNNPPLFQGDVADQEHLSSLGDGSFRFPIRAIEVFVAP